MGCFSKFMFVVALPGDAFARRIHAPQIKFSKEFCDDPDQVGSECRALCRGLGSILPDNTAFSTFQFAWAMEDASSPRMPTGGMNRLPKVFFGTIPRGLVLWAGFSHGIGTREVMDDFIYTIASGEFKEPRQSKETLRADFVNLIKYTTPTNRTFDVEDKQPSGLSGTQWYLFKKGQEKKMADLLKYTTPTNQTFQGKPQTQKELKSRLRYQRLGILIEDYKSDLALTDVQLRDDNRSRTPASRQFPYMDVEHAHTPLGEVMRSSGVQWARRCHQTRKDKIFWISVSRMYADYVGSYIESSIGTEPTPLRSWFVAEKELDDKRNQKQELKGPPWVILLNYEESKIYETFLWTREMPLLQEIVAKSGDNVKRQLVLIDFKNHCKESLVDNFKANLFGFVSVDCMCESRIKKMSESEHRNWIIRLPQVEFFARVQADLNELESSSLPRIL